MQDKFHKLLMPLFVLLFSLMLPSCTAIHPPNNRKSAIDNEPIQVLDLNPTASE